MTITEVGPEPTSALTVLTDSYSISSPDPLSPMTPELAKILHLCEVASRQIKTSRVSFDRTVYNLVFETETRSEGELCFESPEKRSIDFRSVKISPKTKSLRLDIRSGRPFRLESGQRESWILTKDEVSAANDEVRTYERYPRTTQAPDGNSGWLNFSEFGLIAYPFLFEIRADQIRTDWTMTVVERRADRTFLKAIPRSALMKRSFTECRIVIDTNTWRVEAVKYYNCTGNLETVFTLRERVINQPLPANCFDPALKWAGYKEFKIRLIGSDPGLSASGLISPESETQSHGCHREETASTSSRGKQNSWRIDTVGDHIRPVSGS